MLHQSCHPRRLKILLVYYSRTSATATLANALAARLGLEHEVQVARIQPVRDRGYWNWLVRSFVPGSTVRIASCPVGVSAYDRVCLGFPKWTLGCPPVNRYLRLLPSVPQVAYGLFMTFGGFDEDRYLRRLVGNVSAKGRVSVALAVKRRLIGTSQCLPFFDDFCRALIAAENTTVFLKAADQSERQ